MCLQNFAWNSAVFDYSIGTYTGQCVYQTCPIGTCFDTTSGTCVTSTLGTGCVRCINSGSSYYCYQCANGYYISSSRCYAFTSATLQQTYYVSSSQYYLMATDTISSKTGTSPDSPLTYIQEAIYMMTSIQSSYTAMNVTIYVGKGDHYFFICSGDESTMYDKSDFDNILDICNYYYLSTKQIEMDNRNITLQALECSMATTLGMEHNANFWSMCVNISSAVPTIYVQNPYAFFNITGKIVIKNLKFSGINALAAPSNENYDLSKYPKKLCQINTEPTGEEGTISLTKVETNFYNISYKCKDQLYTGSTIPTTSTSSAQCSLNSYSKFSTTKTSSLSCSGYIGDSNYFTLSSNSYHYYRKKTLFNLYAFSDMNTVRNTTPELYIENCTFEYFLKGYESLIDVETNNFDVYYTTYRYLSSSSGYTSSTKNTLYYSQGDRGAQITIINSTFKHSRFCKGMIVYRKAPFDDTSRSLLNLTHIYMKWPYKYDNDSFILIANSTFYNLNIYNNVTALAAYGGVDVNYQYTTSTIDTVNIQYFIHKGIVLNVEDFGGKIEIINNTFKRNFNFIPAIYYGHISSGTTFSSKQFSDDNTMEYQLTICDEQSYYDKYFFQQGISQDDDIDNYYDEFERLTTIYISRNKNKIIIKANTFQQNIGTFGGAISINSPNWVNGNQPYVLIYNNIFKNNMAYFSGNAIYIKLTQKTSELAYTCAGVTLLLNTFTNNIGMKIHNGGAASIYCWYLGSTSHQDYYSSTAYYLKTAAKITVNSTLDSSSFSLESTKLNIEDNYFESNFAGMKGTALYLRQITSIRINNCTFLTNGPVYATQEYQYSPYISYFSSHSITYYDPDCFDEMDYLSSCNNDADQMIIWSRVQGAVHVIFCQTQTCLNPSYAQALEISDSVFQLNQAGPILDSKYTSTYATASQIHIVGGFYNYLYNNQFIDNSAEYTSFPNTKGTKISKFFPTNYFSYSMSSMINIYINPESSENFMGFNTTFYKNKFYRNKNIQVLGFLTQQQYSGSIIKAVNYAYSTKTYYPIINIKECDFKDNFFIGEDASLIYVYDIILKVTQSTFINNGYLYSSTTSKEKSDLKIDSQYNDLYAYTFSSVQQYGVFMIKGDIELPFQDYHYFYQNTFSYIFSEYGGAYSFFINNQYASLTQNTYKYMFAKQGGALLYGEGSTDRSTILMEKETGTYLYGGVQGAIYLSPTKQDLMSLYCNNSYFNNIIAYNGGGVNLYNAAKVTLNNVTFTRTDFTNDMATYIRNLFTKYTLTFNTLAEQASIIKLTNNINQYTGYLNLLSVYNSQSVKFANTTIHSGTYSYINYVEAINSDFNNSISQYSPVADVSYSKLRISNTYKGKQRYISNNTGTDSGAVSLYFTSAFVGENLYIYNNTSKAKASAYYMSESSGTITNTTFIKNSAGELGTVVVETNSVFQCIRCNFISNYAYDSSGIFAYNNLEQYLQVKDSTFINNTATSNLMTLLYTKANISNTQFVDNIAQKVNNGLSMINSNVFMMNVTINFTNSSYINNNDYSVDTGFISLNYQSYLLIQYSTIQYCRGSISAFMYVTGSSEAYIYDSILKNIASKSGYVIFGSMALGVNINRVKFISNSQIDVYLENTVGYVYNNYFYEGSAQFIQVKSGSLDLQNNTFLNGYNLNIQGKALYCYCKSLNATNNLFKNLSAVQGGAIYLQSLTYSKFKIQKNNFTSNFAQMGGAIYILNAAYLDIIGNNFVFNTAAVISPQTIESSKITQKGQGGAIYYGCTDDDIKDQGGCIVNIKQANWFISNYAQDEGGAIQRVSYAYNEDGTNKYMNNSAYYGSNAASYPKSISVEVLSNGDYVTPYTSESTRLLSDISYVPTFVSGTPFSFNVYVLDQFGKVYNIDSSSKCIFKYNGANSSSVIVTNNEVIAVQGVYYFKNVTIGAQPGSEMSFKLQITGLQTYDNSIEFIDTPFSFNVTVRECVMGEELTSDLKCRVCQAGTYLYYPPSTETACKSCPENAKCFGKYMVAPSPGYWRSSNISENFILCQNVDACLGGDQNNSIGKCDDGYKGIICGDCDNNYYKSKQFTCTVCPERIKNIIQISFIMVFAVCYVIFLVRSTLNTADKEKPLYSVYMKIMTNHIQVLSAIANIDYKWPTQIEKFQSNQESVSSISDQVFSFDCFFMQDGKDDGFMPVYYQKLTLFGLMPIILGVCDYLIWILICFIKGRDFSQLRSKTTSTLVVLLFLVHPNIVKSVFLSFNCLDVDGEQRLKQNISSVCYKGEHLTYLMLISMPSVILWCLGIPFFALLLLYANRKILTLQDETTITETEHRDIVEAKMKYGFIFAGYRGETYYWEVILLYRKIGIIMATVYLSTFSNEAQVLAVMLIIVLALLLQLNSKPYYTPVLNKMEIYSLQVSAFTLYAGMYYVTGSHYQYMNNNGLAWFFLTFIVTPNALFILFWAYYMRMEILKEIYSRRDKIKLLKKVFKIIACQTIQEFEQSYIIPMKQAQVKIKIVEDGTLDRVNKVKDEIPNNKNEEEPISQIRETLPNQKQISGSEYNLSDVQIDIAEVSGKMEGTIKMKQIMLKDSVKLKNLKKTKKEKAKKEMKVHHEGNKVRMVSELDDRNLTSNMGKEIDAADFLLDLNWATDRDNTIRDNTIRAQMTIREGTQRVVDGENTVRDATMGNTLSKMKRQTTRIKQYLMQGEEYEKTQRQVNEDEDSSDSEYNSIRNINVNNANDIGNDDGNNTQLKDLYQTQIIEDEDVSINQQQQ